MIQAALAAIALFISAGSAHAQRVVINGQMIQLSFVYSVNPDCSARGTPRINITQQPQHGRASVAHISDFPNFREPNIRTACNRRRVGGTALRYTAQRGYAGPDSVSAEVFFPSGVYRRGTFNISVR